MYCFCNTSFLEIEIEDNKDDEIDGIESQKDAESNLQNDVIEFENDVDFNFENDPIPRKKRKGIFVHP